ncbi:MAG: folate family ECF transporter S component [Defluviitaleaceae bacterium]|nr:folate family ECF transporter S component [Defluviitaleaceae bacterium]MCL2262275.1 folate family ECF transporter S component [Defluviitaleaceae bacterium]
MREISRTQKIVTVALLIAMDVVLTRVFSINTPILRIGFGFLPVAVCAMMFGPIWAAAAAALADIIGITLFAPMAAPFPGFTLSAALVGVVFGLFLYKSRGHWFRILCAAAINCFGIGLLLNTFWLTIITDNPFFALLPTRLVQSSVMIVIQFVTLNLIEKTMGARIRSHAAGSAGRSNVHQA